MELREYVSAPAPREPPTLILGTAIVVLLVIGSIAAATRGEQDEARLATAGEIALLADASSKTGAVQSARMTFRVEIAAGEHRFATEMEGVVRESGENMFTVTLPKEVEQFGGPRSLHLASDGVTTFMRVPPDRQSMFEGKEWLSAPAPPTAALAQTGVDPQSALEFLTRDSIEDSAVTRHGDSDLRGVRTQQYRVVLDLDKLAQRQPEQATALADLPPGSSREMPVRAFIDEDGLVRRMEVDFDTQGFSMRMIFEMFDIGRPVTVEVPRLEDTVPLKDLQAMFEAVGMPVAGVATPTPGG